MNPKLTLFFLVGAGGGGVGVVSMGGGGVVKITQKC